MGRIKWNQFVNSQNTNLNNVSKTPPDNLKNTMPDGGQMRNPLDIMGEALRKAVFTSAPVVNGDSQVNGQPGKSSREGNFDYKNPPANFGTPACGWRQPVADAGRVDHNARNNPGIGIQSNLNDVPSIWGRKYTSQN